MVNLRSIGDQRALDIALALLEPLAIHVFDMATNDAREVRVSRCGNYLVLGRDRQWDIGVSFCGSIGQCALPSWLCGKDLLKDILNNIDNFIHYSRDGNVSRMSSKSRNPYLGCKSLEEALVKKDLMSNGN